MVECRTKPLLASTCGLVAVHGKASAVKQLAMKAILGAEAKSM